MSKESVWLVQDWKWCPKCGGRWGVTDQCECCSFNAAPPAQPAERCDKPGCNCAAIPAAPAEEGDGKEGDDCERCNGIGGWGRLYDGPSHLPSIACPDCNGTGKKPTGAAR